MMPESSRLVRLVGDDGVASGGGLPLPDAFTAVVQELLDSGPKDEAHLTGLITRVLDYKERRILATWGTWENFAGDILAQLAQSHIITHALDKWYLGLGFADGERLIVIPERNIGITIYSREERRRRNALTRARLDLKRVIAQLDDDGVADARIHRHLHEAVQLLGEHDDVTGDSDHTIADDIMPASKRPSADEVARAKYGLGDIPAGFNIKNPFGADGKRTCVRCGCRKAPGEYAVYQDGRHVGSNVWFLRGHCNDCEVRRGERRYKR